MVRNYALLANRRNTGTLKTGGAGNVDIANIQTAIQAYGIIREWRVTSSEKWSLLGKTNYEYVIDIFLLPPAGSMGEREVRTELYLQAESIVETLKNMHVQLVQPPRIVLEGAGGMGGIIEGSIAMICVMLWGVGPEWLYGTALLMRRRCNGVHQFESDTLCVYMQILISNDNEVLVVPDEDMTPTQLRELQDVLNARKIIVLPRASEQVASA